MNVFETFNPALYALAARHAPGIVPVASGDNAVSFSGGTVHGYSVRPGYNLVTGLGTVNGQYLVPELARSGSHVRDAGNAERWSLAPG